MANPAADLLLALTGQTIGSVALVSGTNLFIGDLPTEDLATAPLVGLLNTGGPAPEDYLGGNRESYCRGLVQVTVLGAPDTFSVPEGLARGVFEFLHLKPVTGYVRVGARDSQPAFLGRDDAKRGIWVVNFELQWTSDL